MTSQELLASLLAGHIPLAERQPNILHTGFSYSYYDSQCIYFKHRATAKDFLYHIDVDTERIRSGDSGWSSERWKALVDVLAVRLDDPEFVVELVRAKMGIDDGSA